MSCLFRSLSYYITNIDENDLRKIIVEYLEEDPIFVYPNERVSSLIKNEFSNMTLEKYLRQMRKNSTWGGAIEIRAFCEIFLFKVEVVVLETGKIIEFIPATWNNMLRREKSCRVLKITWNGFHYEPFR